MDDAYQPSDYDELNESAGYMNYADRNGSAGVTKMQSYRSRPKNVTMVWIMKVK
jgi:hypothetical protein